MKHAISFLTGMVLSLSSLPFSVSAEESASMKNIRVMPLGDSITDGFWLTGGYRNTLGELLIANNQKDFVEFVGPNWGGTSYNVRHAGYSGYSIDNIPQDQSISGARTGLSSFFEWMIEEYPADVICLQIGTNDILSYYDLENIGTRLDNFVEMVLSHIPEDGMLYLATIPCMDATNTLYINEYYFTSETMDAIVDDYNKQIKEIVAKRQEKGESIALADINSVLDKDDLYDGVHPNEEGYQKMGNYWYQILNQYLTGAEVENPPVQSVKGDINKDGVCNLADAVLLQNHLIGTTTLSAESSKSADLNEDSIVSAWDYVVLKRILLY